MKVIFFGKALEKEDQKYVSTIVSNFQKAGHQVFMHTTYYQECIKIIDLSKEITTINSYVELSKENIDLLISMGGDGTILRAATLIKELNIPILGINMGRLGFLSNLDKTNPLNIIDLLEKKEYEYDRRSLLKLITNAPIFGNTKFALNDFTLLKRDSSSMISVHTYINEEFLNTYWADGIIISTPTGSTGYSLSCGGPIIFPSSKNFVITPVAPHNLTARPIIIPDDRTITLKVEGRTDNFLCTLDSRVESIDSSVQLSLAKNDFSINLIRFRSQTFSQTIRDKLNWGIDSRN